MPKSWHALPLPTDPRMLVKAPDFKTFERQEHALAKGFFFLDLEPDREQPIAAAMMDAIEDIKAIKPGQKFILERYPQGLSVTGPSGWKFVIPYDMEKGVPVEKAQKASPKGNPRPRGKATA